MKKGQRKKTNQKLETYFIVRKVRGSTIFLENRKILFPRHLDRALNHEILFHEVSFS